MDMPKTRERVEAERDFERRVEALKEFCKANDLQIGGCGCCGSAWVQDANEPETVIEYFCV